MMDRDSLVTLMDAGWAAANALISLACLVYIVRSLRRRFVFVRGEKAHHHDHRAVFWIVILSWFLIAIVFFIPPWRYLSAL